MARSKYYGYTMCGYPGFQRWSLSELPLSIISVFNLSSTQSVSAGNNVPINGTIINQTGANLQGNSIWIPGGFYRVSWSSSITTAAASQVVLSLNGSNGSIATSTGATSLTSLVTTIGKETHITVGPTGTTLTVSNAGTTDIAVGSDFQISITRIL